MNTYQCGTRCGTLMSYMLNNKELLPASLKVIVYIPTSLKVIVYIPASLKVIVYIPTSPKVIVGIARIDS